MPRYPRCYFKRRTFVILDRAGIEQAGYLWTDATMPGCEVWRMNAFAVCCDVCIDDIHAFQADGGRWRYCFARTVRPFTNYELIY